MRSWQYLNDADTAIQYGEEVLKFFKLHIKMMDWESSKDFMVMSIHFIKGKVKIESVLSMYMKHWQRHTGQKTIW